MAVFVNLYLARHSKTRSVFVKPTKMRLFRHSYSSLDCPRERLSGLRSRSTAILDSFKMPQ